MSKDKKILVPFHLYERIKQMKNTKAQMIKELNQFQKRAMQNNINLLEFNQHQGVRLEQFEKYMVEKTKELQMLEKNIEKKHKFN